MGGSGLRVIDFGRASALRSQTLWHAVAYGVSEGAPPTLSFVRPAEPYVCLGYHRRLDEVDEKYCAAQGLPVLRRMVGGGPVYLDSDQLFFQICLPQDSVSPARSAAIRDLLTPAVAAYRAAGVVAAELDANLEISLGDRKICGHGAGQIEDAVVVCGNLIERFDHERATSVLRMPDGVDRAEVLRLMRRYVAATPADPAAFKQAAARAYARALGLRAEPGDLTSGERAALAELDARFSSEEWTAGPGSRAARPPDGIKIRAGVWVGTTKQKGQS
ncbi:lipoate-protein ligase A [Saccharomonospora marina XMU15]|uniref:Lipoate-protein ligase A n=1 Tax=Saccharomonospora marina XMU15 TaxID=882083 RepID=H5X7G6_9PSEU|nr:lipoate--protein ligase family protein [Saccharomonospora marina]EHR50185.1 lipoate-protein ligase A [Saccharomonospora marina XMU15]